MSIRYAIFFNNILKKNVNKLGYPTRIYAMREGILRIMNKTILTNTQEDKTKIWSNLHFYRANFNFHMAFRFEIIMKALLKIKWGPRKIHSKKKRKIQLLLIQIFSDRNKNFKSYVNKWNQSQEKQLAKNGLLLSGSIGTI